MKKKIVISSSMKFKNLIESTINNLNKLGFIGQFPNLNYNYKNHNLTPFEKYQLAQDHYKAIKNSDAVYFILPNGYMGTSCKIELGYSIALEKLIYFSEYSNDISLDIYPKKIISLDNLIEFKNQLENKSI